MEKLNVVVMYPRWEGKYSDTLSFDQRINLVDGIKYFRSASQSLRSDKDESSIKDLPNPLAEADIIVMGAPVLKSVVVHAPRLKWVHSASAGVSNVWKSDLWNSNILLTSGRGTMGAVPIAEYVIAGIMTVAKGFSKAYLQKGVHKTLPKEEYQSISLHGKTIGIIGLGGIGKEVAVRARALGMRVIATRRNTSIVQENVDGADLLLPARDLPVLLAASDFVVVCVQWTTETQHLLAEREFQLMKKGAVLVNPSRGEVIDEDALIAALKQGTLRGAVLDTYEGEQDEPKRQPRQELLEMDNVLLTPHNSAEVDGYDIKPGLMLFRENLRRFLANEKLLNVVDREVGY